MIFLIIFLSLLILYILSLAAKREKGVALDFLKHKNIAHRGLFDRENAPENSLAAYKNAIDGGFPIEIDVQLSRDKKIVVFHDFTLKRMCGVDKKVRSLTLCELKTLSLGSSDEKIPTLDEVLRLVDGRVPLLIELKVENLSCELCPLLNGALKNYKGAYAVQSFNPLPLIWYRFKAPRVFRGQLSGNIFGFKAAPTFISCFIVTHLISNFLTFPDFISYQAKHKNNLSLTLCRFFYRPVTFGWTARSISEYEYTKKHFSAVIFDTFKPEKPFY